MLKKRHRLRHAKDISKLYSAAKRLKIGDLFILYKKNDLHQNRIGVIVSKKFSLRASERNKQRRLIVEALKNTNLLDLPLDILITYTKKGKMLSYKDSLELLKDLSQKLQNEEKRRS